MNSNNEKSFLVFGGGNDRAVLGFLRALSLCGQRANIVARTNDDKILRTRYRKDVKWIRDSHVLTMKVFAECVQQIRKELGQRKLVVLPSTEYFNTFILQHRTEIEYMNCEIPLVEASIYNLLTDKRTATDFFATEGFSVPREFDTSSALEPPLIAKPLHNVTCDGLSLYPQLLATRPQLDAFHATQNSDDYFFQEYIRGESLYLLLYLPRNASRELKWSQRNLLQQPDGKSMLLAEPATFHQTTTAVHYIEVLRRRGFWGLGMIEVIQSGNRQVFIEMNPRIWGPVQFCVDQQQPLLQAFIGEVLHEDPSRFATSTPGRKLKRKKYFWLGGLADTLAARKRPVWHTTTRSLFVIIACSLRDDVFLRMDSWRCFIHELIRAVKMVWNRERA